VLRLINRFNTCYPKKRLLSLAAKGQEPGLIRLRALPGRNVGFLKVLALYSDILGGGFAGNKLQQYYSAIHHRLPGSRCMQINLVNKKRP